MTEFVDRLQRISEALPLRLVPLEISEYGTVVPRMRGEHRTSMAVQQEAISAWTCEIERRFTAEERRTPLNRIPIARGT
jgi:hypothetical protein